jgi:hypothetical protein
MEFLVSSNLNILNRNNEPTFVVRNRKEVIDLTLGTNKIGDLVSNCLVSDEPSFSDHRYICFQIGNITTNYVTFRNPKRSKWKLYKDDLKGNLEIILCKICTIKDIDRSVDSCNGLLSVVNIAFNNNHHHNIAHLNINTDILLYFRYLATGETFTPLSSAYRIGIYTVHEIIK